MGIGTTTPDGTVVKDSSDVCVFILDVRMQCCNCCLLYTKTISRLHSAVLSSLILPLTAFPGGVRCAGSWSSIREPTMSSH